MNISGDFTFAAPRPLVWDALQDPRVLASVLPGCERLDLVGEHEYEGQIRVKIGPVQGEFAGKVKLTDLDPPGSFRMAIDGRGQQGFVKATAGITLTAEGEATRIAYESDAQVGGRIASVGQRLVETSARAIVRQSLEGLDATMRARAQAAAHIVAAGGSVQQAADAAADVPPSGAGRPSDAAMAVGVASAVAREVLPTIVRRAVIILGILVLGWFLLGVVL